MNIRTKTSKWIASLIVGLSASASVPQKAHAAVFVLIEGIDGDVTEKGKERSINAESFVVGTANAPATTGRRRGGTEFQDVQLNMKVGQTSPRIFEACIAGRILPKVIVTLTRNERNQPSNYLTYTLTNCVFTNYKVAGKGDQAEEQISVSFEKLEMEVTTKNPKTGQDEKTKIEWDSQKK